MQQLRFRRMIFGFATPPALHPGAPSRGEWGAPDPKQLSAPKVCSLAIACCWAAVFLLV